MKMLMTKKIKIILMVVPSTIILPATLVAMTACSPTEEGGAFGPDYQSKYASYINERTFAIKFQKNADWTIGTCWIVRRDTALDFSYYLATNIHVVKKAIENSGYGLQLGYNSDFTKRNYCDYSNVNDWYTPVSWEISPTRCISAQEGAYNDGYSYECDVDFELIKIDFGTANKITKEDPNRTNKASPLLTRLNKLNKLKNICNFVNSSYSFINEQNPRHIHIGGFPARQQIYTSDKSSQWTSYNTSISSLSYGYSGEIGNQPLNTTVNWPGANREAHLSYKQVNLKPYETPEITPGASGSMIIDDNFNVIAIFNSTALVLDWAASNFAVVLDASNPTIFGVDTYNVWNSFSFW